MTTEWVAPAITGVFALILGIVSTLLARRGAKLGAREQRAPDVQELWAQQELDRQMRRTTEDLWWNLRRAFQSYFRRVSRIIVGLKLTAEQEHAFNLTPAEQKAIDAMPPSDP